MISPYNTLQEQQVGRPRAPWRILVVCMLLNKTHGRQVRPMIDEFFAKWPDPQTVMTSTLGMPELIRPLGFGNRRTEAIGHMSEDYALFFGDGDPSPDQGSEWVRAIRGCGQYAQDSIAIFHCGKLENVSSDTWLQKYVEWKLGIPPSTVPAKAYEVQIEPRRES